MQFFWKYIDDLAGKGIGMDVLSKLMFYVSASLVPMALPLAILLASLMTMGNMGENFELTAMKASGISLQRIVAPLLYLSLILTIAVFFFSNYILPVTNLKLTSLLHDITQQRPELQIPEGAFYNGIDGYSVRVTKKNYKTSMLYGLMIYDHKDARGNTSVTVADSGYMQITKDKNFLIFTMYDGYSYSDQSGNQRTKGSDHYYPFRRDKFKKQEIVQRLVGFNMTHTDESLFKQNSRMLSLRQIKQQADSMQLLLNNKINRLYSELKYDNIMKYSQANKNRKASRNKAHKRAEIKNANHSPIIEDNNTIKPNSIVKNIHNNRNIIINNRPIPSEEKSETNIDTTKTPPVPQKIKPEVYETDINKILANMSPDQQDRVINEALNYARDSKTYITSSANNTDDQARIIRKYYIDWWEKFTLSVSCIIFFLIGAPLGAIIRKGGFGMPVVISVAFFVLWYVLTITFKKFVREGVMSPVSGMWTPCIILLVIGLFLVRKATFDSAMFNVDTYLVPVKKFTNKYLPKALKFKKLIPRRN
jgi:lipopolysaccharide export system permease protein